MTIAQSLIYFFISPILGLLILVILVQVIMSLLISFNVINIRNQFVATVYHILSRIVDPILAPLRRIIPTFSGIDFSPFVAILILQWLQGFVVPKLYVILG